MSPDAPFTRFPPQALEFLAELAQNNERDWFKANQDRYEQHVRGPARAFVRAMGPRLARISRHFVADDRKVGGSIMRPQKDTRFSRDKTPYKTNVGIQFRHEQARDVHAPGFYVHLDPGEAFLGVGAWRPDAAALAKLRSAIAGRPRAWRAVRDEAAFRAAYELEGESLRRAPRGVDPEHPLIEDLKRKDHVAVSRLPVGTFLEEGFVDLVTERFRAARGYVRFLCKALDIPC